MNPTLVFDIETIPDIAGLLTLHELDALVSDAEVAEMAFQQRRQKTGSDLIAAPPVARRGDLLRAA